MPVRVGVCSEHDSSTTSWRKGKPARFERFAFVGNTRRCLRLGEIPIGLSHDQAEHVHAFFYNIGVSGLIIFRRVVSICVWR